MRQVIAATIALACPVSASIAASPPVAWTGKLVIARNASATVRGQPSEHSEVVGGPCGPLVTKVIGENGAWLQTADGWLLKSDAVLVNDAVAFFSSELRAAETSFALMSRGLAYRSLGRSEEAFRDFDRAVAIDGAEGLAYYHRATAWRDAGQIEKSRRDLSKAIELLPGFPPARVAREH